MLKRILVPIDGTEYSWRALDYAAGMAALSKGELIIVTVTRDGRTPFGSAPLRSAEELAADSSDETAVMQIGNEVLDGAKTIMDAHPEIRCSYLLINGSHIAELINEARDAYDCDVIVIGSRGMGAFKGFWKNSVSRSILNAAPVPVVVVK